MPEASIAWLEELDGADIPYRLVPRDDIAATVADLAAGEPPCILHSHFSSFDLACARAARRRPTVAFWHIHTPLLGGLKSRVRNAVRFGVLSRGVTEIFCVAPQIARDVRRRFGPKNRVSFMPNAIDLDRFRPLREEDRRRARARLGLPDEGTVLKHFGWQWERKGGEVYLRAAKELRDGGRELVAATVGSGDRARSAASRLGMSDAVRTLAPTNEVRDLYAAADVLVMPSLAEGMPFSLAEALACGRPAVATEAPGQREIAGGLAACRLTSPEPNAVAEGVATMLDRDADAARRDAIVARRSIEDRMGLQVWTSRLLARYDAAVAGAAPR